MSQDSPPPEHVVRYCPECGKRVRATAEFLSEPRRCPSCERTVLFYDYPREEVPLLAEAEEAKEHLDRPVYRALLIGGGVGMAVLAVAVLLAIVTGQAGALLVFSLIWIILGLFGFLAFMDSRAWFAKLKKGYEEAVRRQTFAEEVNRDLALKYHGFKVSYDKVISDDRARQESEAAEIKQAARADRDLARVLLEQAREQQDAAHAIAHRFLQDTRKNIKRRLTPNNFASCKDQFIKAVDFCRRKGYDVPQQEEAQFLEELKEDFKEAVRTQLAKEEQQRIKARIREEQKAEREIARALEQAEAEQRAIEKALEAALAETRDEHSAQVEELRRRLQEAEEKSQRAMSMAQQTKAGNVYVISNLGSFGEGLYKIGMTRRLEPMDRVKELGDASVPFPFDVHMMISCDNAPALETALHRAFHKRRINRVNLRKEFFRVDLEEIRAVVLEHHGEVEYVAEPEALEYNESRQMTDEDFDFVSSQVDAEVLVED